MATRIVRTSEQQLADAAIENRRYKSLTDEQALSVGLQSISTGEKGKDPTHFRLRRQWFVNIAYYLGFTDADYAIDTDPLEFDSSRSLQVLPYSANHIGRLCRGEIARLAGARPDWDVAPTGADQRRRQGAKVAQQHLDHYYEKFRIQSRRHELAEWMVTTGMGFYYLSWNPMAGARQRAYKDPFTEEFMPTEGVSDEDRKVLDQLMSYEEFREGDFDFDVMGPFQISIPIGPYRWDDLPWITITRLRSLDWCWEHYPDIAPELDTEENEWSIDGQWWRRLASLVNFSGQDFVTRGGSLAEGIEVHEHWRPAFGRFEKGLRAVFTNNRLLENGPNPFQASGLPIWNPAIPAYMSRIPGRIWGKSLVEDLIGAQEDYNRTRRQSIAQGDVLAKPQLVASYESDLNATENSNAVVWKYRVRGGQPQWLPPPPIGAHQAQRGEQALYDLQTISAQSEASLGQNPSGVDSGVQLAMLQERDRLTIGPTVESIEQAHRDLGQGFLMLTSKFVKVPRMVSVVGTAAQADVNFFRGLDLADQTNVVVKSGSMMPRSRAETMSHIQKLITLGVLDPVNNPDDKRLVLEAHEVGGLEHAFFRMQAQRRRARIEEEMFVTPSSSVDGALPDVDEFDDHMVHMDSHMAFVSTDDYETLPPVIKMAFKAHMAKHQAEIGMMMQTAQFMQGAMAGGGPGGGSEPKQPGEASPPRDRQPTPGSTTPSPAA